MKCDNCKKHMTIAEEFAALQPQLAELKADVEAVKARAKLIAESTERISQRLIKENPEAAPQMQPILDQLNAAVLVMCGGLQ